MKAVLTRILISLLLLVPVYWHKRIQAGDLGSHTYNAWLAQLVEQGQAPGLELAPQTSNVLFDLLLAWLFPRVGPDWAERLLLSLCVLAFFWGAMGFLFRLSRREPWFLAPCVAMLTYGWTYHMGLFNFYLGAALALIGLSIAYDASWRRAMWAVPWLAAAWVAHALPVVWAAGVLVYGWMAQRVPEQRRIWLLPTGVASVAALRVLIELRFKTVWVSLQVLSMTAVDQFWVFGIKYYGLALVLGAFWGFLVLRLTHLHSWRWLLSYVPLQLTVLTSAIVALLPTAVMLPGYTMSLSLIAERMTLLLGLLVCGVLAGARPLVWQRALGGALAGVFFLFLYLDTAVLGRIEQSMEQLVSRLPAGSRIVAPFYDPGSRVFVLAHTLDRVCVGRCFSYGNYEPSSKAFRVRATRENPIVMDIAEDRVALNAGKYAVKRRDLPLYQVTVCGARLETDLCIKPLEPGQKVELATVLSVTPILF